MGKGEENRMGSLDKSRSVLISRKGIFHSICTVSSEMNNTLLVLGYPFLNLVSFNYVSFKLPWKLPFYRNLTLFRGPQGFRKDPKEIYFFFTSVSVCTNEKETWQRGSESNEIPDPKPPFCYFVNCCSFAVLL